MKLRIALERDEDGMWVAECPILPGCLSRGNTSREALDHMNDTIEGYLTVPESHEEPTRSGDGRPFRSIEERKDDDDPDHDEGEDEGDDEGDDDEREDEGDDDEREEDVHGNPEDDTRPNIPEITSERRRTMATYVKESSPGIMRDAEVRMFDMVSRLKDDIEQLYEEMEILLNRDMLLGVEKSKQEMKRGELYGWGSFKEIVDE